MAGLRERGRLGLAAALILLATVPGGISVQRTVVEPGHEASITIGAPAGGGVSILRPPQQVDHDVLAKALGAAGIELVEGTSVYAARVLREDGGLRYDEYDAGGGAFTTDFWPASSIKVVAAVGALEFLAGMGFTGAATVTTEEGSVRVRDLYEEAIRDSSNLAYDWLVSIAGVDWLNTEFLVPRNGFTTTVIQRSYTDPWFGVVPSPAMTISEGERTMELAPRDVGGRATCADAGNCSNLLELSDTIRRIVLADQIPAWERFVIAPEDAAALRQALLDAEGFIDPAAQSVFGTDTAVFNKPGETPEDECVDVGVVEGGSATESGYLLAISTPVDGRDCASVAELASVTLSFLEHVQP